MMGETDLIKMSLCIFLPTAFALVLLFFPKGSKEYMRWWALLGTAVTFVVSMILFVDYLKMLDNNPAKDASRPSVTTQLVQRADAATKLLLREERTPKRQFHGAARAVDL